MAEVKRFAFISCQFLVDLKSPPMQRRGLLVSSYSFEHETETATVIRKRALATLSETFADLNTLAVGLLSLVPAMASTKDYTQ